MQLQGLAKNLLTSSNFSGSFLVLLVMNDQLTIQIW